MSHTSLVLQGWGDEWPEYVTVRHEEDRLKLSDRLKSMIYVPHRTCHLAWKWDGLDGHDPVCSRCGHEWPRESRNGFDYSDFNYCPYCGAKAVG